MSAQSCGTAVQLVFGQTDISYEQFKRMFAKDFLPRDAL